jgi:AcrR family transcriptional regulator
VSITARKPQAGLRAQDYGETATQRRVIDAAVGCILECGFYRASANEIVRRAGVTWGVIQHYYGTREALMLAVLQDGARHFAELMEAAHIEGDTADDRLEHLLDVLTSHYGQPEFLAYLQVLLNMDLDPRTSVEVRKTMRVVAARSQDHVRRLLREALGPATSTPDLANTVFLVLRGFAISQQLQGTMAYDVPAPKADRAIRQRRILAGMLASYLEGD